VKPLATLGLAFLSTLAAQTPDAGKLMTVEGTISVEGAQFPPGYLRVVLDPVGAGNELSTEARSDGTFTIGSVAPGYARFLQRRFAGVTLATTWEPPKDRSARNRGFATNDFVVANLVSILQASEK
jgi:hypothetical protein